MKIVISAINLRSGGTLSILNDFMSQLLLYKEVSDPGIDISLLCHSKEILKFSAADVNIIEYPHSIKSYFISSKQVIEASIPMGSNQGSRRMKPPLFL